MKIKRTTSIDIKVHLDEQSLPIGMDWDATDSPIKARKDCKAILLSMWDGEAKNALKIDLWTKEMEVNEMNHFFFQTIMTMADTYHRATSNKEIAMELKQFGRTFAEKLELFKK